MFNKYGMIMVAASFINAVSQILLKKSADQTEGKTFIKKMLNLKVVVAYMIFIAVFLINLYAYQGVDFKYGGAVQSIGQVFVLVLSLVFCNEKITKNRMIGNFLIICGVLLFSIR